MARTKLKKLSELKSLPNVFSIKQDNVKDDIIKYFNGKKIFTLEIGCGHGDYSVELSQKYPGRNFIGIDVKGARIYNGAVRAIELNIKNVAFIITKAEWLNKIFEPKSIEEIYIPFPEPHIKRKKQIKILTAPFYLRMYKELLTNSGIVHFKTDDEELFEYTISCISEIGAKVQWLTEDYHRDNNAEFKDGIKTSFERHYHDKGRKIKYIRFRF